MKLATLALALFAVTLAAPTPEDLDLDARDGLQPRACTKTSACAQWSTEYCRQFCFVPGKPSIFVRTTTGTTMKATLLALAITLLATSATAAPARHPPADETYGAQPPIDTWVTCGPGPCEPPLPDVKLKARATPAPARRDPGLGAPPEGQPPIDTWVQCGDGVCELETRWHVVQPTQANV
ncbi:uncharacterized protein LOC62_03G003625 [Vanrija pseudolonga]|uniref:Uncharacterized protein n=1 Tax=Vanrija pseudolonga TaxID=143232 RepID=A0AAF1BKW7_9TREE|nr:hypothetical protein LOC62_03G003625 [Vanrija pseudolonga]